MFEGTFNDKNSDNKGKKTKEAGLYMNHSWLLPQISKSTCIHVYFSPDFLIMDIDFKDLAKYLKPFFLQ